MMNAVALVVVEGEEPAAGRSWWRLVGTDDDVRLHAPHGLRDSYGKPVAGTLDLLLCFCVVFGFGDSACGS